MSKNRWLVLFALAGVFVCGGLWWMPLTGVADPRAPSVQENPWRWIQSKATAVVGLEAARSASAASAASQVRSPPSPLDSMILPTFRAAANAGLAVDATTRVDVERLYSLYSRDEAQQKLKELSAHLPVLAQRELTNLFQQYAQYAQAVAQTYPPGLSADSVGDAAQQLKGLHELRQQYFGVDGAQAMFGEEEKTSLELLDLMRKQADPTMSLEEKAAQAQEAWKKTHPDQP